MSAALLAVVAGDALANGWEHGAIPFESLLRGLDHEAAETRLRAAESLGLRGQPEAVAPLLARLELPEESPQVRSALYIALGRLGDARGIAPLTRCLEDEQREELRADCALALGLLADPTGLAPLLHSLESDDSFLVQSRAVDALGSFDQADAVTALADIVAARDSQGLRLRAIRALGRSGAEDAIAPLLAALDKHLGAAERLAVVDALGQLAAEAAREPLTELLDDTNDAELRMHIAVALGAIHDGDAVPTLVDLLDDPDHVVRYFAVESLRQLGAAMAAQPIAQHALDLDQGLRSRSDDDLLAEPVAALADLSLLEIAVRAVTELDPQAGQPALLAAAQPRGLPRRSVAALRLTDGFYRVRRAALYGLAYTDSPEAFALLSAEEALRDPDPRIRAVVVRSLGVLDAPGSFELLLPSLDDPAAEVRWTAAAVLGLLEQTGAVPALTARLEDEVGEVRKQAALALAYLGDPAPRPVLLKLAAGDPDRGVREAADFAARSLAEP